MYRARVLCFAPPTARPLHAVAGADSVAGAKVRERGGDAGVAPWPRARSGAHGFATAGTRSAARTLPRVAGPGPRLRAARASAKRRAVSGAALGNGTWKTT